MNYLDFILLAVLAYNGFMGFKRGLVGIIFDLVALVAGLGTAMGGYQAVGKTLQTTLNLPDPLSLLIAFLLLWGAVFFSISFAGKLMAKIMSATMLGPANRVGGLGLGLVKGGLAMMPVLVLMVFVDKPSFEKSLLISPVRPMVFSYATALIPAQLIPLLGEKKGAI